MARESAKRRRSTVWLNFYAAAIRHGETVFIVSHKTEFGHFDTSGVNLRQAAREWMKTQGFFHHDEYGLSLENVYFEGTRAAKLDRIGALECTHFIDDLEEVLGDPAFPPQVKAYLVCRRHKA